jgi:ABC-type metal ion transport system substrate-binding protein
MKPINAFLSAVFITVSLFSCTQKQASQYGDYKITLTFKPGEEQKIAEAFLAMKDSTQILLTAGTYNFDNLSIAQVKHILIKGEGHDKTILDFKAQSQGGEGISN